MVQNEYYKIGRNEPCPCGSGKKYKKCHGVELSRDALITSPTTANRKKISEKLIAKEKQREKQQGLGRPIISTVFQKHRFVAVGRMYYYEKKEKWQTFHDFLVEYIKLIFGKKWLSSEQKKELEDRHPILQWIHSISKYRKKILTESKSDIISSPMTGAVFAYLTLAYNLYLIAHNVHLVHSEGLHARLVKRLKNKESFYPAFYETMVAASFIKAGFTIELEDEEDTTIDHAEFVATSQKTSIKYSVEAKHRQAYKKHLDIKKQLFKALKKDLPHKRVVFVNLNVKQNVTEGRIEWLHKVIGQIRNYENALINGQLTPEAYVFVTNHPFLYNLDSFNFPPAAVVEGFKIPDLKLDTAFLNLRDALKSREKHIDMFNLIDAMKEYDQIPSTFDGGIPEYTFGEIKCPRLIIGNKYLVPDASGKEFTGELLECAVIEQEKVAWGVYKLDDGRHIIAKCPLSDKEIAAYKKYPDTFFGTYKKVIKQAKDPLDWYDFFHGVYKHTPKEKLLEFMKGHQDFEEIKNESQEELAKIYCEISTYEAINTTSRK